MTCVYCDPKSRMRIFEWVDFSDIFGARDESGARYVLQPDHLEIVPSARPFPGRSPRVETALQLPGWCVVQVDQRSRSKSGMRSQVRSRGLSSAYFMNELFHCKKVEALMH